MFAYQGFNSLQKHNKKAEEEEEEWGRDGDGGHKTKGTNNNRSLRYLEVRGHEFKTILLC